MGGGTDFAVNAHGVECNQTNISVFKEQGSKIVFEILYMHDRGVFRTQSNIYYEAVLRKYSMVFNL